MCFQQRKVLGQNVSVHHFQYLNKIYVRCEKRVTSKRLHLRFLILRISITLFCNSVKPRCSKYHSRVMQNFRNLRVLISLKNTEQSLIILAHRSRGADLLQFPVPAFSHPFESALTSICHN